MFVFLSIAKEGKHSNNQYIVLANLILVKMLPHNYGKPTPFLFASALLRSINIYMCVCLYMCVLVYVCVCICVCVFRIPPSAAIPMPCACWFVCTALSQCHIHCWIQVGNTI